MMTSTATSGLEARIHLDRLRANAALVRERTPDHVRLMGVVKCDGYGHGAVAVSRALQGCGVDHLVVSTITEGLALRHAGIAGPILVLSDPLHPRLQDALDHDLTLTVADAGFAARLLDFSVKNSRTFAVHVKVDIGLGRFGLSPDQTSEIMAVLARAGHVHVQGVYSHLSCTFHTHADSDAATIHQITSFNRLLDQLDAERLLPPLVHLGSSTGLLGFAEELCAGRFNALRIGTLFYGFTERPNTWEKRPAPIAEVSARIMSVRDVRAGAIVGYHRGCRMSRNGRIAVIGAGFCHGLHGDFSGALTPLVHGRPALLVGKPALAQSMIDVTGIPEARPGSEVFLAGPEPNMHELAGRLGRGTWEMLLPMLTNSHKTYCGE